MPRIVRTFGERGQDEEIDRLWAALDALKGQAAPAVTQPTQTVVQAATGSLEVRETDGSPDLFVVGLEVDNADFTLSQSGDFAKLNLKRNGYDVAFDTGVALLTASQVVLRFKAVRSFTLPISLTGSVGESDTPATAQTDFDIRVNGVSKGTIRFAAAATTPSFIFAAAVSITASDKIRVIAPATPDATLTGVYVTLAGV